MPDQIIHRVDGTIRYAALAAVLGASLLVAVTIAAARPAPGGAPESDPLGAALDHFYNLEFDAAQRELDARLAAHPCDLRALNALASNILQREMFRRELLEAQVYGKGGEAYRGGKPTVSPEFRQKLFGVLDKAENQAKQILEKNPRDEEALYWLGVSHVTRAIYRLSLEKARMDALGEAKEARNAHAQLLEINPNYTDAYMVIGTYDYIVGSLPWYTKVVAALAGYRGNRERGLDELRRVTEQGLWARTDAKSFLAILYFREKRYADALRLLEGLEQVYPRNFLLPQEIARIYKAQENWRAAAEVYDSILQKYESGAPGYAKLPAPKIYFQTGEVYARLGEKDKSHRRYEKAARLQDDNIYVYRSELAAAGLELERNQPAEARRRYQRVASAVPSTDEGRAAAQALKNLAPSPRVKPRPAP